MTNKEKEQIKERSIRQVIKALVKGVIQLLKDFSPIVVALLKSILVNPVHPPKHSLPTSVAEGIFTLVKVVTSLNA